MNQNSTCVVRSVGQNEIVVSHYDPIYGPLETRLNHSVAADMTGSDCFRCGQVFQGSDITLAASH